MLVGAWHHFALLASCRLNGMTIYRNGVVEAQKDGSSRFTAGDYDLYVGWGINPVAGEILEFGSGIAFAARPRYGGISTTCSTATSRAFGLLARRARLMTANRWDAARAINVSIPTCLCCNALMTQ